MRQNHLYRALHRAQIFGDDFQRRLAQRGAALRICEHFATAPTQGLALIKPALNASVDNTLEQQLDLERQLQRAAGETPDYAEGVRAFMEKRKPNFTGRK